jgi:hypothetical protein
MSFHCQFFATNTRQKCSICEVLPEQVFRQQDVHRGRGNSNVAESAFVCERVRVTDTQTVVLAGSTNVQHNHSGHQCGQTGLKWSATNAERLGTGC